MSGCLSSVPARPRERKLREARRQPELDGRCAHLLDLDRVRAAGRTSRRLNRSGMSQTIQANETGELVIPAGLAPPGARFTVGARGEVVILLRDPSTADEWWASTTPAQRVAWLEEWLPENRGFQRPLQAHSLPKSGVTISGVTERTGDPRNPLGSRVTIKSQPPSRAAAAVTASSKSEQDNCSAS